MINNMLFKIPVISDAWDSAWEKLFYKIKMFLCDSAERFITDTFENIRSSAASLDAATQTPSEWRPGRRRLFKTSARK